MSAAHISEQTRRVSTFAQSSILVYSTAGSLPLFHLPLFTPALGRDYCSIARPSVIGPAGVVAADSSHRRGG